VLVGNKADLADKENMSATVLESEGQRRGYPTYIASAKTGENVESIFATLGELMVADISVPTTAEPEGPKSLAEVVDFIVQDFCAQYGDLEKAMLIVQHQLQEAGVDIRRPHRDAVLAAIEGLAKAEELSLSKTVSMVNLDERRKMVIMAKN
jgi:hypothetical protein